MKLDRELSELLLSISKYITKNLEKSGYINVDSETDKLPDYIKFLIQEYCTLRVLKEEDKVKNKELMQ